MISIFFFTESATPQLDREKFKRILCGALYQLQ